MASGAKLTTVESQLKLGVSVEKAKVDANAVVPAANVTYKRLNLGISVVDATTDISYVLPAAGVAYVDLSLSAVLDNENRNPYVIDSTVILDQAYINIGKRFSEQVDTSDILATLAFGKRVQETVTAADLLAMSLGFIRVYADTTSITDSIGVGFSTSFHDAVSITDSISLSPGLNKSDVELIIDDADISHGPDWAFGKSTVELIGAVDLPVTTFGKVLADTFSSIDLAALGIEKPVADVVSGITDSPPIFSIAPAYADSVIANEALLRDYGMARSDAFSAIENIIVSTNKTLDDNISNIADSGALYMTDYCDVTYFAEAYVGIYQNF